METFKSGQTDIIFKSRRGNISKQELVSNAPFHRSVMLYLALLIPHQDPVISIELQLDRPAVRKIE